MLSRCLYGAQLSVIIGLSAAFIATLISTLIGIVSGYFGGKVDLFVQRFVDAWMIFPELVVLIVVVLGIASVLVVSVVQKHREIGILRAMGTTRGQILRIFLVQGAVVGAFGVPGGPLRAEARWGYCRGYPAIRRVGYPHANRCQDQSRQALGEP